MFVDDRVRIPVADPSWGSCLYSPQSTMPSLGFEIRSRRMIGGPRAFCQRNSLFAFRQDSVATTQGIQANKSGLIYRLCEGPKRPVFPIISPLVNHAPSPPQL